MERYTILQAIDKLWQEHLYEMDSLRYSIGLRGHGQRDPLLEYKAEAFKIFDELMVNVKTEICHNVFRSASSLMAFENFLRNAPQQTLHRHQRVWRHRRRHRWRHAGQGQRCRQRSGRRGRGAGQGQAGSHRPKVGRNDPALAAAARNTRIAAASNHRPSA